MGYNAGLLAGVADSLSQRPAARQSIDLIGRFGAILATMFVLVAEPRPGVAASPLGEPSQSVNLDQRLNFDIPPQPLTSAIYAYTAITGVEALAAGELLANRRSAGIRGTLRADEALQAILAGTGLAARFVDVASFTLTPLSAEPAVATEGPTEPPRYTQYSALVQQAVKRALCRESGTRPGYYRTAVELWIAPSGAVARAVLIGSTGDVARDRALSETFNALSIGLSPPADLPQPATLLILPRSRAADCAELDRTRIHE